MKHLLKPSTPLIQTLIMLTGATTRLIITSDSKMMVSQ